MSGGCAKREREAHEDPAQLGRDPGRTGHIVSAILFVPPFSTPNPGIYRVGGTDEWGEPPSLYPS